MAPSSHGRMLLLLAAASAAVVPHDVSAACAHPKETAPTCANNATLFAYLESAKGNKDVQTDNCATCACAEKGNDQWAALNAPARGDAAVFERSWGRCCDGWNGTACDVCETLAACPSRRDPKTGTTVDAYNCTAGLVEPTAEELDVGKRFSCVPCGSGIENTYCAYTDLPGASFDVVAFAERAEVAWRLGTFRDDNVHFPKQNFYDYAAYFEGNLTGCSYANDVCAWDDSKKCLTLTCGATDIDCPPAGLDECPGWTYDPCKHHYVCENECVKKSVFGCCKPKDGDDDDVMHGHRYHVNNPLCCAAGTEDGCQPTEIFWNGPATTFSCELDASEPLMPATARRCYLNQKHTGVDGFPLTCHVGNCLYNASQHNSTPPSIVDDDVHFREPRPQRGVVPQLVALGAAVLALAAGAAAAYATSPLRRRGAALVAELGAAAEATASPLFAAEDGDDEAGAPLGGLGGGLDVAWADLTLECGPVVVLDGARGSAAAGEVQAVLGPSGAGKSSLLRCVGGRARGRVSGSVSLGGAELCAAERRATLAFVPQDDGALPQTLTVAEHLLFHAELRLGDRADAAALAARVAAVLAVLELETCAATRLGARGDADDDAADGERGVSGGEARRVSVAAELLGTPAALLLDEPTSRLDSRAALRLARSLRRVARGGADAAPVAVLATMHQPRPEIFLSLDGLCVVCRGVVAWRGSVARARRVAAALEPAGCENPGDVLLDAIAARGAGALAGLDDDGGGDDDEPERPRTPDGDGGAAAAPSPARRRRRGSSDDDEERLSKALAPGLRRSRSAGAVGEAPDPREVLRRARFERLPPRRQLAILLDRQLLRVFRAPSLLCLHAGGALAAAVCLGSIDSDLPKDLGGAQRRIGAIFFALFFLQLLALSALSTFREDAAVADAERVAVGGLYGPLPHLVSVLGSDLVLLRVLPALLLALVVYPYCNLRPRCAGFCALRFASALGLASAAAGSLALALGALRPPPDVASALGSLGALFAALFGGVAVGVDSDTTAHHGAAIETGGGGVVAALSQSLVRAAAAADALFYAFRAAVVGEFAGAKDTQGHLERYVIDGHKCDPTFPSITVDVNAILSTLSLPTRPAAADAALARLALVAACCLGVAAAAHSLKSSPDFSDGDDERGRSWYRALRERLSGAARRARSVCGPRSVEIPAVDDPELQLSDSPPRGRPVPRHLGHAWGSSERLLTDDDARSDGEPAPPPPLRRVDDAGGDVLPTKRPAIAWALPALVGGVVFANHYARDTPSALQEALEARWPMSSLQFGLLHNVYYVPNVFMPLVAGAMAQAAADATAPLVFFTGCACAGHALWAAGVGARSFPLLLGARCVLGACYEAIDLGSIPFMGPIFRDDWAKVVGVTNALLRVGSVATFGLSPALLAAFGLDAPLYAAGAVGAASFGFALVAQRVVRRVEGDRAPYASLNGSPAPAPPPRLPVQAALAALPAAFWWYALGGALVYAGAVTWLALGSKILAGRFGLSVAAADGLILCPEAAIVVLGPAVGFLVDKKRSALTARLVAAAVSALSFPLAFGAYYGDGSSGLAYGTFVLSAGWSVFNTLFWATITVVSPPEALPVATGVVGAMLNVGPAALPALLAVAPKSRALLALACVSAAGAACLAVAAACVPPPEAPLPPPEDDDDALFGEAPPPRLACRDVSLALAGVAAPVLDRVSLSAAPGGVTALLGPSGAGKSSLLDVLAGRRTSGRCQGTVDLSRRHFLGPGAVDGGTLDAATARQRRLSSAFAPQDDVLPPHLTCREHLTFHAKLRLPGAWPAARKRRVARAEADALALDARCYEETRLGKASGGQRRRVTLATTLLAKRQLLFCDEPTTGLDAATALVVCRRLQDVSRLGVTVVAVLHQPRREIFVALDRVALLVRGRLRVCGTPADVRAALDARAADGPMASNPADAMLDLAQAPGGLAVAASDAAEAPSPQRRGRRRARPAPVGGFQALCLLATRERRQCLRDGPLLLLQYVPALVVGAILGLVYEDLPSRNGQAAGIQDRLGLAFVLCTSLGLSALSAPPRSRRAARLLARERDSYGFAQAFAAAAYVGDALPLRVAPPLALAGLVVGLSHAAKTYNHALGFVLAAFQIHYVLAATGRAVGAVASSNAIASAATSLLLLFNLLLSGFFINPADLAPVWRALASCLPMSYAYEALVAHEFALVEDLYISSKVGSSKIRTGPYPGEAILHCFGFDADDALADHLALVAFGAGADLLTCLFFGLFAFEKR